MNTRRDTSERSYPVGGDTRARLLAEIPLAERRLDLGGVATAVLEGGAGPPLVVLHGVGQFAATWMRVIPALAASHRVIVPDLPGQGASVVVDGPLDAGGHLAWLGALIEETCSSPPALVGQQAGGAMAIRYAVDHSGHVRRLVLVDSFGLGPFRPAPSFALAMVGFLAWPTPRTRDRFLGQCMVDLDDVHGQMGERWELLAAYALEGAKTPGVRSGGRSLMKAFAVSAIPDADLARVTVPTTLIWGRDDVVTRVRVAENASARYGWPLHVIDDCGADPHLEQPAAFTDALRSALDAPTPRPDAVAERLEDS
jgi:pimeloyl-ACP methyl ester carboxylesterase